MKIRWLKRFLLTINRIQFKLAGAVQWPVWARHPSQGSQPSLSLLYAVSCNLEIISKTITTKCNFPGSAAGVLQKLSQVKKKSNQSNFMYINILTWWPFLDCFIACALTIIIYMLYIIYILYTVYIYNIISLNLCLLWWVEENLGECVRRWWSHEWMNIVDIVDVSTCT